MRTENTVQPILMQVRVGVGVTGFFQRVGNKTQPPQRTYIPGLSSDETAYLQFYRFELFGRKCNL
jgi:hypothetical protein